MKTEIDFEIKRPSALSLIWKDLCSKKYYYKIKNNTSKPLSLYIVKKSTQISQDYKKLGQKLKKNKDGNINLNTTVKFNQKIQKTLLNPNEKIIIYFDKLLPVYWINEETNMFYNISGFRVYEKIVFDEYDEEEEEESDFVSVEEIKEELVEEIKEELVEEIKEEIKEELVEEIINNMIEEAVKESEKPKTEYETGMNKIYNNFNDIDDLIKRLSLKE